MPALDEAEGAALLLHLAERRAAVAWLGFGLGLGLGFGLGFGLGLGFGFGFGFDEPRLPVT